MGKTSISLQIENFDALKKAVEGINQQSERVIKSTLSDLRKKGPTTVRMHVGAMYNIDKKEIQPGAVKRGKDGSVKEIEQAASIKTSGDTIDTFTMVYSGRRLTPLHFGMSPKKPAALLKKQRLVPGAGLKLKAGKVTDAAMVHQRKAYTIKLTIKKGHPTELRGQYPTPPFLAPAGKNGSGPAIPFQRMSDASRKATSIHTLSVPQMIDNPEVNAAIYEDLVKYATTRISHHTNRFMK